MQIIVSLLNFGAVIVSDRELAQGMSACEAVREKSVKILTKEEIEGMRVVCRVRPSILFWRKHGLIRKVAC
jgi:hypothetical protein